MRSLPLLLSALAALIVGPWQPPARGACLAPPSDLVHWWPGDGDTDDVISGYDGTLQNGATFASGFVDQTFSVDGSDDHVTVPSLASRTTATVEAWLNPSILTGGYADSNLPGVTRRMAAGGVFNCQDWGIGLYGGKLGAGQLDTLKEDELCVPATASP